MWTFYYSNYDIILCYQAWLDRNSLLIVLQLTSYRVTLLGESPATVSKLLLKITIENAQIASFTFAHVYTSQQTGIKILVLSKFPSSATRRRYEEHIENGWRLAGDKLCFFPRFIWAIQGKVVSRYHFVIAVQSTHKMHSNFFWVFSMKKYFLASATCRRPQGQCEMFGDSPATSVQVATRRRPRCVAGKFQSTSG